MNKQEFNERMNYGSIGEQIVKEWLLSLGYAVYPAEGNCPHAFDMLTSKDKKDFTIVEVKTQCKSKFKPDIGINYSSYLDYKQAQETLKMKVFLVFVDWSEGAIYGGFLDSLDSHFAWKKANGDIIEYPCMMEHKDKQGKNQKRWYFYQPTMKYFLRLSADQIQRLKDGCKSDYDY